MWRVCIRRGQYRSGATVPIIDLSFELRASSFELLPIHVSLSTSILPSHNAYSTYAVSIQTLDPSLAPHNPVYKPRQSQIQPSSKHIIHSQPGLVKTSTHTL